MDQTIIPYFTVSRADEFIDFIVQVFGAVLIKRNYHEDKSIQHARLELGNSTIMLQEESDDYPANNSQMHVYVDNVENTYQLALSLNCLSLMAPMMRPHGDRMAGFKDPFGNIWWVAKKQS